MSSCLWLNRACVATGQQHIRGDQDDAGWEDTHTQTHTLSFTLDLLQSCTQIQFQLHDLRRHANASLSDVKPLILRKELFMFYTLLDLSSLSQWTSVTYIQKPPGRENESERPFTAYQSNSGVTPVPYHLYQCWWCVDSLQYSPEPPPLGPNLGTSGEGEEVKTGSGPSVTFVVCEGEGSKRKLAITWKRQFLWWALEVGSKNQSVPVDSHVKLSNFTTEINMFAACYKNRFDLYS